MNESPKHVSDKVDDESELPELGRAVDRHFFRAKVVISAIAVAVTIGMGLDNLVSGIRRDIQQHRVDVERDLGALRALTKGNEDKLEERGIRIGNLEQQVYELKTRPTSRADPFTGTMGRELKLELERRIIELEYNQAAPQLQQRLKKLEERKP